MYLVSISFGTSFLLIEYQSDKKQTTQNNDHNQNVNFIFLKSYKNKNQLTLLLTNTMSIVLALIEHVKTSYNYETAILCKPPFNRWKRAKRLLLCMLAILQNGFH